MSTSLNFDVNGLYILLSDRGDNSYTFHWGLYLHQTPDSGYIYHLVNDSGATGWYFEPQPRRSVKFSRGVLVALKIGVLGPIMHQPLLDRLREVPIAYSTRFRENITCRVWLKEAIFALDEEGFIKLIRPVNDIESEANRAAIVNKSQGTQVVAPSTGSQA